MPKTHNWAFVVALSLFALIEPGHAADKIQMDASGLSNARIDQRIQFIEERLDASKRHGQIWQWSWLAINGGGLIGNGVAAALADNNNDTINFSTNAVLGAIGVADQLLRPLEARFGASPIQSLPDASRDEKLAKLRAAEDLLRRNAERAEDRTGLVPHAANAGLATAAGLVVGLTGTTEDGLIVGVSTFLGGVAYILTEPSEPKRDWERYQVIAGKRRHAGIAAEPMVASLRNGGIIGLRIRW